MTSNERMEVAGTSSHHESVTAGATRLPLAFSQERIWAFENSRPEDSSYSLSAPFELRGELSLPALEQSLRELAQRHEALRTRIVEEGSQPWQIVDATGACALQHTILPEPGPMSPERVNDILAQLERKRIDLSAPLFRCLVWTFSATEHLLVFRMHHIVVDRHAMGILMGEWAALYRMHASGQTCRLPEARGEVADFVNWERQIAESGLLRSGLQFWRERLSNAPSLNLPIDRARPARFANRSAVLTRAFRSGAALGELARKTGTTVFSAALGCYYVLLSRWSGQEDISVGCVVSNRSRRASLGAVGCFFNTVVIRCTASRGENFRNFLRQVRERTGEALAWQFVPIDAVVSELCAGGDPSKPPLFQAMFTYQGKVESLDLTPFAVSPGGRCYAPAPTELSFELVEGRSGTTLVCQYSSDIFDRSTIERFAAAFERIVESAARDADARLSLLSAMAESERHKILQSWNDTRVEYPGDPCLHQLIETQVHRMPDAPAVASDGQALTYDELNRRANRLARLLRSVGVESGSAVAICMHRGLGLMEALLAVLKAGAAYVPLDPASPPERLRLMLTDSRARVVLTSAACAALMGDHETVLLAESWRQASAGFDDADIEPATIGVTPRHPAYMIYTSGSTGVPKGTLNSHRGVVNRLRWMQDRYDFGTGDSILQKTSISFDVSVWELFCPLMSGSRLVMATPDRQGDPEYVGRVIDEEQITILHFVPSMLRSFLDSDFPSSLISLRHVICSGEALTADLVARFSTRYMSALHNLYGPTEAAIDVTSFECQNDRSDPVPIGRPVANTQCYVLDEDYEPVPIGASGQLFLGGIQVGDGYLNRPALTAERFIPDPFAGAGWRMYATGDVARFRLDGNLEYLGRNDDQVKIRGFRIELREIEAKLRECPGILDAVVLARDYAPGDRRLIGYVLPEGVVAGQADSDPSLAGLAQSLPDVVRERLTRELPHYMVPSTFVVLDHVPLTTSGKVDRRALPTPESRSQSDRPCTPAATPTEESLSHMWRELLKLDAVSAEDDFFALGGHSLLATRLVTRIQNRFRVRLPVHAIFQSPTVRELARVVDEASQEDDDAIVPLASQVE